MKNKEIRPEYLACPIRQVISQFGDKWSLLVLYDLSLTGASKRYGEIGKSMPDCSSKMLSVTLRNLERIDLIERKVFAEVPPHVEYRLTERGRSLIPHISALMDWARSNLDIAVNAITD